VLAQISSTDMQMQITSGFKGINKQGPNISITKASTITSSNRDWEQTPNHSKSPSMVLAIFFEN